MMGYLIDVRTSHPMTQFQSTEFPDFTFANMEDVRYDEIMKQDTADYQIIKAPRGLRKEVGCWIRCCTSTMIAL